MKKILLLFICSAGLMLSSCYKEPENGVAKIRVVDINDVYVQGANIQLTGPTGSYINVSGTTDFTGTWEYIHDPALEVILHVHVTAPSGPAFGDNIIRITPDETESITVKIQ